MFCRVWSVLSHPCDLAGPCAFYSGLLQAFDRSVALCGQGSVAAATKSDLLLRVQAASTEADVLLDWYVWVTALSARSGAHPASQIFVPLDVLRPEEGLNAEYGPTCA